jgi:hypothetical protein
MLGFLAPKHPPTHPHTHTHTRTHASETQGKREAEKGHCIPPSKHERLVIPVLFGAEDVGVGIDTRAGDPAGHEGGHGGLLGELGGGGKPGNQPESRRGRSRKQWREEMVVVVMVMVRPVRGRRRNAVASRYSKEARGHRCGEQGSRGKEDDRIFLLLVSAESRRSLTLPRPRLDFDQVNEGQGGP